MEDLISRKEALNFEMTVECTPTEVEAIKVAVAAYAKYLKALPAVEKREETE